MEESGHYYTVYFTALAVGFRNEYAKKYAFYAQLPDEVSELDAKTLHLNYGGDLVKGSTSSFFTSIITVGDTVGRYSYSAYRSGVAWADKDDVLGAKFASEYFENRETEDERRKSEIATALARENEWRVLVEQILHALTGKNAYDEQEKTKQQLKQVSTQNKYYLMEIGFLLHKLGDTYAHTDMHNPEKLYKTSENVLDPGHGLDGEAPDQVWQRDAGLYENYIKSLYDVLYDQATKVHNRLKLSPRQSLRSRMKVNEVLRCLLSARLAAKSFGDREVNTSRGKTKIAGSEEAKKREMIKQIRNMAEEHFKVSMDSYAPELNDVLPLNVFLKKYDIPSITQDQIRTMLERMLSK